MIPKKKAKNESVLIIPDIHGRIFWKEAVAQYPDIPAVFLGDYVDPYCNRENISSAFAVQNFEEILAYKRQNVDSVTLLFGNHDLHYLSAEANCSRKDEVRASEIRQLIEENFGLFQLAAWTQTEKGQVLFTHAGILTGWWHRRLPEAACDDCQAICDVLNAKKEDREFLLQLVKDVSGSRGGELACGSPVWADVSEHAGGEALPAHIHQVFGHTQQRKDPVLCERYSCLDCRRAFLLEGSGQIAELDAPLHG